jgi:hypothetical protein
VSVIVVVSGSTADSRFAVTTFGQDASGALTGTPVTVYVKTGSASGCVVACSGTLAAVGSSGAGSVWIYDISNPWSPAQQGAMLETGLSGIGALSLDGTNLVAGDSTGPNIVLIDTSSSSPAAVSVTPGGSFVGGVSSIVLKGSTALASGKAGFAVLSASTSPSPQLTQQNFYASPVSVTIGSISETFRTGTCDFDGSTAALADEGGNNFYLYSISGGIATPASATNTGIHQPPFPIAVLQSSTALGSTSSSELFLGGIALGVPVQAMTVIPSVGAGALKFLAAQTSVTQSFLAVGTNNGSGGSPGVTLFNTNGWPNISAAAGSASTNLANSANFTTSLGVTAFWPPGCQTAIQQFLSLLFAGRKGSG